MAPTPEQIQAALDWIDTLDPKYWVHTKTIADAYRQICADRIRLSALPLVVQQTQLAPTEQGDGLDELDTYEGVYGPLADMKPVFEEVEAVTQELFRRYSIMPKLASRFQPEAEKVVPMAVLAHICSNKQLQKIREASLYYGYTVKE